MWQAIAKKVVETYAKKKIAEKIGERGMDDDDPILDKEMSDIVEAEDKDRNLDNGFKSYIKDAFKERVRSQGGAVNVGDMMDLYDAYQRRQEAQNRLAQTRYQRQAGLRYNMK